MNREMCRNNLVFESDIMHPIEYMDSLKMTIQYARMDPLRLIGDRLYGVISKKYLFCVDLKTRELLWDKTQDINKVSCPTDGDGDYIFLSHNGYPVCLRAESGQDVWKANNRGVILASTERGLICRDVTSKPELIVYRSKETGEKIWKLLGGVHGYLNQVAAENEYVILEGIEGLHVCKEQSGKVIWDLSFESWLNQFYPGTQTGPFSYKSLGPLVDGVFYMGFGDLGALVAVNVETGKPVWTCELGEKSCPGKIIHYQGKIYFNVSQGAGYKNHLTCVDATSGELVFKTEENFTPEGCRRPIISNNYLIAPSGSYISFFDLDKQEFVWRHKMKLNKKKVVPFSSLVFVYEDQLISYDYNEKEIYWFQSK